jgi:hypothetical protein
VNPPLDPKIVRDIAGLASKPLIEKGIEKVAEKVDDVEKSASDSFKVLGREMSIDCPESIQHYSVALEAKQAGFFGTKARFEQGPVQRATIKPIMGMTPLNAISMLDNGFEINLKKLKAGEIYILDTEYVIKDPRFVDSLVSREVAKETSTPDSTEYWMVAQLKFLDVLYGPRNKIRLKDVDFNVNVGVHQDVNTKVPSLFKEQLETLIKLAGPLGRDEVFNTILKMRRIKNQKYGANSLDILGELVELFTPQIFKKYIVVKPEFTYFGCEKGTSVLDLPWGVWPKFMTVISRTDLGYDKPAAKGTLIFSRKDFMKSLEDIFA